MSTVGKSNGSGNVIVIRQRPAIPVNSAGQRPPAAERPSNLPLRQALTGRVPSVDNNNTNRRDQHLPVAGGDRPPPMSHVGHQPTKFTTPQSRRGCRSRCCQIYTPIIFGALLILFSVLALSFLPAIFEKVIRKKVVLQEGGETFARWYNSPVKIYYRVYLFEVLNPRQILRNGTKPHLRERGPYTYIETRHKEIVRWSDDGTKLWYKEFKGFYFDRSLSAGDITDTLTIINVPMTSINGRLDPVLDIPVVGWFLSGMVNSAMRGFGEELFVTKTVEEFLFKGYRINLLEPASIMDREVVPGNSFALFHRKNMTWNPKRDGIWGIYTGAGDTSDRYTQLFEWNGKPNIETWQGGPLSECNTVRGTSGSQFHPFINKSETLYSFTTDICRAVPLEYRRTTDVHGIEAWRFSPPTRTFSSPLVNEANRCYCNRPATQVEQYCDFNGILDISKCIGGAPILVSAPHLQSADPWIRELVDGLNPIPDRHTTYVDIEPITGQVIRASRRLQLNVRVKKSSLRHFDQLYDIVFPVAWIDESGGIDEKLADKFQAKLFRPITIVKFVLIGLILLGICLVTIPLLICTARLTKRRFRYYRDKRRANRISADLDRDQLETNLGGKSAFLDDHIPPIKYTDSSPAASSGGEDDDDDQTTSTVSRTSSIPLSNLTSGNPTIPVVVVPARRGTPPPPPGKKSPVARMQSELERLAENERNTLRDDRRETLADSPETTPLKEYV